MKIIKPSYEISLHMPYENALLHIEKIARSCYKSEHLIAEGSAEKMIRFLIKKTHTSMLEHASFSVKFISQRSFSHELVRHRLCSFAQESQRYCAYDKKSGNMTGEITFVHPPEGLDEDDRADWEKLCKFTENSYLLLRQEGVRPEIARGVLPNDVKTEIWITANLREWRHIFQVRALGTTGKPDPRMLELMIPLLKEMQEIYPAFFDDLVISSET